MELLIAVLIALGTISSNEATTLTRSEAETIVNSSRVAKAEYERQLAIIGLEDSDM